MRIDRFVHRTCATRVKLCFVWEEPRGFTLLAHAWCFSDAGVTSKIEASMSDYITRWLCIKRLVFLGEGGQIGGRVRIYITLIRYSCFACKCQHVAV